MKGKEESHHAFLAGLIGGYFVFGEYNNVNYQVSFIIFDIILISILSVHFSLISIIFNLDCSLSLFSCNDWSCKNGSRKS